MLASICEESYFYHFQFININESTSKEKKNINESGSPLAPFFLAYLLTIVTYAAHIVLWYIMILVLL